jgi:hypothetical protein
MWSWVITSSMRARSFLPVASICCSLASMIGDVDGDDDAVERLLDAILEELLEERHPLVVVVGLGGVAARRVEEDGLVGEPPVAVARAADAADAAAAGIEVGEDEAGVAERRGLAGAGRADHRVPGSE